MSSKINYEDLVQNALVCVVRDLLRDAAVKGLPGNHHFYITYNTDHPRVEMPDYLRDQYPESITIVIQYDFWDLEVLEEGFSVTLSFNNMSERLSVPFDAMTSFVDPSAKFGLQFTPRTNVKKGAVRLSQKDGGQKKMSSSDDSAISGIEGNVISFDAFRKKN